jgi:hypothetical protein
MDMEVLKPFDSFLQKDLMLAYENHVNENLEAGCFGAVKGHPYIRKCMEYLESRNFCDQELFSDILKMEKSKRHDAVNPPILPEVMKIVLHEFLLSEKHPVLSREYFTAKNIVTGKIEMTRDTVTIHHFATQYHSEEWHNVRIFEQNIKLRFGENTIVSKILCGFCRVTRCVQKFGLLEASKYYFAKYIKKES